MYLSESDLCTVLHSLQEHRYSFPPYTEFPKEYIEYLDDLISRVELEISSENYKKQD